MNLDRRKFRIGKRLNTEPLETRNLLTALFSLIFIVAVVVCRPVLAGAAIELKGDLDAESSFFDPGDEDPDEDPGEDPAVSIARVSASSADRLRADFSGLGMTDLKFTVESSAGVQADFPEPGLLLITYRGNGALFGVGSIIDRSPLIEITGYKGDPLPAPVITGIDLSGPLPLQFPQDFVPGYNASASYNIPAGFSATFSSITFSTTVPASYTMDFLSTPLPGSVSVQVLGEIRGASADHGQFVYLVPEPASFALLIVGLIGIGICRRHIRW